MDNCLKWTSLHYGQFALSLGKESPCVVSKCNLLNTNTLLKRTFSVAPLVCILTEFDCTVYYELLLG